MFSICYNQSFRGEIWEKIMTQFKYLIPIATSHNQLYPKTNSYPWGSNTYAQLQTDKDKCKTIPTNQKLSLGF